MLAWATSLAHVNKATNALYRHPLLVQMSVSGQSAVTVAVGKHSVSRPKKGKAYEL